MKWIALLLSMSLMVATSACGQCTGPYCPRPAVVATPTVLPTHGQYVSRDGQTVQWSRAAVAGWNRDVNGLYWTISATPTTSTATPKTEPVKPFIMIPPKPAPATKAALPDFRDGVDLEDIQSQSSRIMTNTPEFNTLISTSPPPGKG